MTIRFTFLLLLFLVFLVLKLTHVIAWSWWAVTAPLWWPVALGLSVIAAAFAILIVVFVIGGAIATGLMLADTINRS